MSQPVGRQRTWRGQRQAVPTWCYGLDRMLRGQRVKKLHCPQRGDISGCPLGAGNGQGPCTSCSAHHTPGSGSKYYPYSTDEETESQRGKGQTEEVRLRAGLAPRGPDCLSAPGRPHKTVRTGSWGGSFEASCSWMWVFFSPSLCLLRSLEPPARPAGSSLSLPCLNSSQGPALAWGGSASYL